MDRSPSTGTLSSFSFSTPTPATSSPAPNHMNGGSEHSGPIQIANGRASNAGHASVTKSTSIPSANHGMQGSLTMGRRGPPPNFTPSISSPHLSTTTSNSPSPSSSSDMSFADFPASLPSGTLSMRSQQAQQNGMAGSMTLGRRGLKGPPTPSTPAPNVASYRGGQYKPKSSFDPTSSSAMSLPPTSTLSHQMYHGSPTSGVSSPFGRSSVDPAGRAARAAQRFDSAAGKDALLSAIGDVTEEEKHLLETLTKVDVSREGDRRSRSSTMGVQTSTRYDGPPRPQGYPQQQHNGSPSTSQTHQQSQQAHQQPQQNHQQPQGTSQNVTTPWQQSQAQPKQGLQAQPQAQPKQVLSQSTPAQTHPQPQQAQPKQGFQAHPQPHPQPQQVHQLNSAQPKQGTPQTQQLKPQAYSNSPQPQHHEEIQPNFGSHHPEKSGKDQKHAMQYAHYLNLAKRENFAEIKQHNILSVIGPDKEGRPIIAFIASNFPQKKIDFENFFLYAIHILDTVVEKDYVMIYIHSNIEKENRPSFSWLKKIYSIFNRKYKKNLKVLYIINPSFWIKATFKLFKPFISSKFWKKLIYIENPPDLFKYIPQNKLNGIPEVHLRDKSLKKDAIIIPPLFGISLDDAVAARPPTSTGLPLVVHQCLEFLGPRAPPVEGIFRMSGVNITIMALKKAYDKAEPVYFADSDDVHTVAGLLKLYLRELPEPIVPYAYYDIILENQKAAEGDRARWIAKFKPIIESLPEINKKVFRAILSLLHTIATECAVNKMNPQNLAIVFGPNLLRSLNADSIGQIITDTPLINSFVSNLISVYTELFLAPGSAAS